MLHVTFSLTDEYRNGQLSRIHRLNDNLGKLVHGVHSQLSFNETHTKGVNVAKHYKRMREQAKVIHDALKEKLETSACGCSVSNVSLFGLLYPITLTTILCIAPLRKSSIAVERYRGSHQVCQRPRAQVFDSV